MNVGVCSFSLRNSVNKCVNCITFSISVHPKSDSSNYKDDDRKYLLYSITISRYIKLHRPSCEKRWSCPELIRTSGHYT